MLNRITPFLKTEAPGKWQVFFFYHLPFLELRLKPNLYQIPPGTKHSETLTRYPWLFLAFGTFFTLLTTLLIHVSMQIKLFHRGFPFSEFSQRMHFFLYCQIYAHWLVTMPVLSLLRDGGSTQGPSLLCLILLWLAMCHARDLMNSHLANDS